MLVKYLQSELASRSLKDAPVDVVSILPCNVIGVVSQEILNLSSQEIPRLMKGIDRAGDRLALIQDSISFVDVEDVAMAHILAMGTPSAEGRYLAVEHCLTNDRLRELLAKQYPEYTTVLKPDMERKDEETFMKPLFKLSDEKLRNLGVNFTPISDTEESREMLPAKECAVIQGTH